MISSRARTREGEDLRTDMRVQATARGADAAAPARPRAAPHPIDGEPELRIQLTGRDVLMRLRLEPGESRSITGVRLPSGTTSRNSSNS